jgi:hypothetical protein
MRVRTVLVAFMTTLGLAVAPALPAQAASTCTAFGTIDMGKYWLNNNLWGQNSGSGWQCVFNNWQSGDTIGWGTNWGWSGQTNEVKSYASVVLGWHWGWRRTGTELPVRLNAGRDIFTSWNYGLSGVTGTMNVAYDLWLHDMPNPDWQNNPTDEIMIWTHRSGGAGPVGTPQGTVNIAGTSWTLYRGNIGWNVFSFVRNSNTGSVTLHLQDFLNNLVSRGWVANTKYLSSIQAGTEVFVGNGQLNTNSFIADIR